MQKAGHQVGDGLATLLPIIIGSALIFLIITAISIGIVRKKRSELKYDLEKTGAKSEECEILKPCLSDKPDLIGNLET